MIELTTCENFYNIISKIKISQDCCYVFINNKIYEVSKNYYRIRDCEIETDLNDIIVLSDKHINCLKKQLVYYKKNCDSITYEIDIKNFYKTSFNFIKVNNTFIYDDDIYHKLKAVKVFDRNNNKEKKKGYCLVSKKDLVNMLNLSSNKKHNQILLSNIIDSDKLNVFIIDTVYPNFCLDVKSNIAFNICVNNYDFKKAVKESKTESIKLSIKDDYLYVNDIEISLQEKKEKLKKILAKQRTIKELFKLDKEKIKDILSIENALEELSSLTIKYKKSNALESIDIYEYDNIKKKETLIVQDNQRIRNVKDKDKDIMLEQIHFPFLKLILKIFEKEGCLLYESDNCIIFTDYEKLKSVILIADIKIKKDIDSKIEVFDKLHYFLREAPLETKLEIINNNNSPESNNTKLEITNNNDIKVNDNLDVRVDNNSNLNTDDKVSNLGVRVDNEDINNGSKVNDNNLSVANKPLETKLEITNNNDLNDNVELPRDNVLDKDKSSELNNKEQENDILLIELLNERSLSDILIDIKIKEIKSPVFATIDTNIINDTQEISINDTQEISEQELLQVLDDNYISEQELIEAINNNIIPKLKSNIDINILFSKNILLSISVYLRVLEALKRLLTIDILNSYNNLMYDGYLRSYKLENKKEVDKIIDFLDKKSKKFILSNSFIF